MGISVAGDAQLLMQTRAVTGSYVFQCANADVYELLCVADNSWLYWHFFLNRCRTFLYKRRMQVDLVRKRRPRFRRSQPPAFRLTEGDDEIMHHLARHRFLRSTHIAALVDRSLDRTNDRLLRLFHAGYVDRPLAQLDLYPRAGTAPMIYALADCGARRLVERGVGIVNVERSRKNRETGRPFIEHQLEMVDFYLALKSSARKRTDVRLVDADELVASFPDQPISRRNPFELRANITHKGPRYNIGVVPDLVFGLEFSDNSRRCFMVEIDRGTMPIARSDMRQTSMERKMRVYLAAHAAKQHERYFGWKAFRILVVTREHDRIYSMSNTLQALSAPDMPSAHLFLFGVAEELVAGDPLLLGWQDCCGSHRRLL